MRHEVHASFIDFVVLNSDRLERPTQTQTALKHGLKLGPSHKVPIQIQMVKQRWHNAKDGFDSLADAKGQYFVFKYQSVVMDPVQVRET